MFGLATPDHIGYHIGVGNCAYPNGNQTMPSIPPNPCEKTYVLRSEKQQAVEYTRTSTERYARADVYRMARVHIENVEELLALPASEKRDNALRICVSELHRSIKA